MKKENVKEACEFMSESIEQARLELNEPYIITEGDFNKHCLAPLLNNAPDIVVMDCPPTRGGQRLDLILCNMPEHKTHISSIWSR